MNQGPANSNPNGNSSNRPKAPSNKKEATGVYGLWLKFKNRKPMNRALSTILVLATLLVVSLFAAMYILESANDFLGFSQESKQVQIEVPENAKLSKVTDLLRDSKIITRPLNFRIYSGLKKLGENLKPGTYTLDAKMSYDELIYALKAGDERDDIVQITFPEGYTVHDIGALLEENKVCTEQQFVDAIRNGTYNYAFLEGIPKDENRYLRLEGYIFPDTYNFFIGEKPESVVVKFLDAYSARVTQDMYAQMDAVGLTQDQVLTLASIIQKEASNPSEMADVASVFFNRMHRASAFPKLESDVTINYVENDIKPYMQEQNQAMYDAYNTYKCDGLPVGPICSPGLDAINAVLYPSSTDYYFFVTDKEGKYYYATTLKEHEKNIKEAEAVGDAHGTTTGKE